MKTALRFNKCLLTLSLFALSSCAFFSQNPAYDNKKLKAYVQGSGFDRTELNSIKETLSRSAKMAGNIYKVKVMPMTRPLIEAMVDDQAAALSLTKEERASLLKNLEATYLENKTCLELNYEVTRIEKSSQLEDWQLEILDHDQLSHKTKWTISSLAEIPTKSYEYIGSVREPVWFGKGVACTSRSVDLSKDFDVKVTSHYVPFPFSSEATLYWQYPVYEVIDGKEVEVETKDKNFKGYRGW